MEIKALTIKDLKDAIKNLPDDFIVVLGDDEELNGVHIAYGCDVVLPTDYNLSDLPGAESIKNKKYFIIL